MVHLLALAILVGQPWPGRQINRSTWERLEIGMTKASVIQMIGAPGDYRLYGWPTGDDDPIFQNRWTHEYTEHWTGDFAKISAQFDKNGKLQGKRILILIPRRQPPVDPEYQLINRRSRAAKVSD